MGMFGVVFFGGGGLVGPKIKMGLGKMTRLVKYLIDYCSPYSIYKIR